jgi:hypothetical protein
VAVGWCQVTPRDRVAQLDREWRLRRLDDLPVWSLSCFYVRKGQRRQGITFRSWRMIGRGGTRRTTVLNPARSNVEDMPVDVVLGVRFLSSG